MCRVSGRFKVQRSFCSSDKSVFKIPAMPRGNCFLSPPLSFSLALPTSSLIFKVTLKFQHLFPVNSLFLSPLFPPFLLTPTSNRLKYPFSRQSDATQLSNLLYVLCIIPHDAERILHRVELTSASQRNNNLRAG